MLLARELLTPPKKTISQYSDHGEFNKSRRRLHHHLLRWYWSVTFVKKKNNQIKVWEQVVVIFLPNYLQQYCTSLYFVHLQHLTLRCSRRSFMNLNRGVLNWGFWKEVKTGEWWACVWNNDLYICIFYFLEYCELKSTWYSKACNAVLLKYYTF